MSATPKTEGGSGIPPKRMRQTDFFDGPVEAAAPVTDTWVGQTLREYIIERKIDSGCHSDIYLGRNKVTDSGAAIKIYHNGASGLISTEPDVYQQRIEHRKSVRNEGLIDIEAFECLGGKYCLVTEWIDGKRLSEVINEHGPYPSAQAIKLIEQIASALACLHENEVSCCHLSPRTIMITKTGHVKVAGYGMRLPTPPTEEDKPYLPPETAENPCNAFSPAGDVYAMGKILCDLLTGSVGSPVPETIPAELDRLIDSLCNANELSRPTSTEALRSIQQIRCTLEKNDTTVLGNPNDVRRRLTMLLRKMSEFGASDLHLKAGSPPAYRIHGETRTANASPLTQDQTKALVDEVLEPEQKAILKQQRSFDISISMPHIGRFRANVFYQRGALSLTMRRVASEIPTPEELLLPPAIRKISEYKDGLVLVTGATGSGKSTTLATLINLINESRHAHIVTIEDPLEYLHTDKQSFVTQREIGIDVPDFLSGIRDALRQAPDVILLGELRDEETIETAMAASETGHLVMSTLHAIDVTEAIRRVLLFFPPERQDAIRIMLGAVLRAIISQRMVPGMRKEFPRVVMMELLTMNDVIRQCITDNEDHRIHKQLETFTYEGMQSFNVSLLNLVRNKYVDARIALQESPRPKDLEKMLYS